MTKPIITIVKVNVVFHYYCRIGGKETVRNLDSTKICTSCIERDCIFNCDYDLKAEYFSDRWICPGCNNRRVDYGYFLIIKMLMADGMLNEDFNTLCCSCFELIRKNDNFLELINV